MRWRAGHRDASGDVIASRPGRRSNPHIVGGRLLRPLRFLAMTPAESLELNSPDNQGHNVVDVFLPPIVNKHHLKQG